MIRKILALLVCAAVLSLGACASETGTPGPESGNTENRQSEPGKGAETPDKTEEGSEMEQEIFYITIGQESFAAYFADSPAADALKEKLEQGDITVRMRDYGGFEKAGSLGMDLPASNSQITTQPGDIVLYQGNQIVMFYGSNSWSYTMLGKVRDLTGWEKALGRGDVSVTLSLEKPET